MINMKLACIIWFILCIGVRDSFGQSKEKTSHSQANYEQKRFIRLLCLEDKAVQGMLIEEKLDGGIPKYEQDYTDNNLDRKTILLKDDFQEINNFLSYYLNNDEMCCKNAKCQNCNGPEIQVKFFNNNKIQVLHFTYDDLFKSKLFISDLILWLNENNKITPLAKKSLLEQFLSFRRNAFDVK